MFVRPSWAKRGPLYSHYAASMRCVAPDQSSRLVTLHYLTDGTATLRFQNRKREFLVPCAIILKARPLSFGWVLFVLFCFVLSRLALSCFFRFR